MSIPKQKELSPPKDAKTAERAAQIAEWLLSDEFRNASSETFDAAEGDGEVYRIWRENTDAHLGALAVSVQSGKNIIGNVWNTQLHVARAAAYGDPVGPFANFFYDIRVGGARPEVLPNDTDTGNLLGSGEPGVVRTNSMIMSLAREIESPVDYIKAASELMKGRRKQGGNQVEGPENYATALKQFTDKLPDDNLEEGDISALKPYANDLMAGFLRIAETDEPNIIEVTNIMAAIKRLPKDTVDKRYSDGIIKHVLDQLPEFSDRGINLVAPVISKLDVSDCGETAAMTLDLALRKGTKIVRSGDMLTNLRAVCNLPSGPATERAFTALLDVRSAVEVAANVQDLDEMTRRIADSIEHGTQNSHDTIRAKGVAEFAVKRAMELHQHAVSSGNLAPVELEHNYKVIMRMIDRFKKM